MAIEFPPIEAKDGSKMVIAFPAEVNGKRVHCSVSFEALQDNFGGNNIDPMTCFQEMRPSIEQKAREFIDAGRFEDDGSIVIRSADGA